MGWKSAWLSAMSAVVLVSTQHCLSAALFGIISLSPQNVEEHLCECHDHSHAPCYGLSSTFADFSQLVCWEQL